MQKANLISKTNKEAREIVRVPEYIRNFHDRKAREKLFVSVTSSGSHHGGGARSLPPACQTLISNSITGVVLLSFPGAAVCFLDGAITARDEMPSSLPPPDADEGKRYFKKIKSPFSTESLVFSGDTFL